MKEGVFVTGTGTDVGKTYVSALLVKTLREQGRSAGYFKPALSGARRRDGALIPGDAEEVCRMSGLPGPPEQYVAYLYEQAVSPHLAARLEGPPITRERIMERFSQVAAQRVALHLRRVAGRLRAVFAVLRAAPALSVDDRAEVEPVAAYLAADVVRRPAEGLQLRFMGEAQRLLAGDGPAR